MLGSCSTSIITFFLNISSLSKYIFLCSSWTNSYSLKMALGSDILVENVSASAGLHNLVLRPEPRPILRSSASVPFPSTNDRQHQVTCMYFSSLECTNTNKQITNCFLKMSTFCRLKDLMSHFPFGDTGQSPQLLLLIAYIVLFSAVAILRAEVLLLTHNSSLWLESLVPLILENT